MEITPAAPLLFGLRHEDAARLAHLSILALTLALRSMNASAARTANAPQKRPPFNPLNHASVENYRAAYGLPPLEERRTKDGGTA